MGMHHFYCSVSGGRYFQDREEFRDAVNMVWPWEAEDADNDHNEDEDESGNAKGTKHAEALVSIKATWQVTDNAPLKCIQLSDVLSNGLLYSQEDVDASSNFVLLYEREEDSDEDSDDLEYPSKETEQSNIMEVFDVSPAGEPDSGEFRSQDDQFFNMYSDSTVIIMYTAYLIMKQASPRLTPHMIYQLVLHSSFDGIPEGIDYGPVKGIHVESYVTWSTIADINYECCGCEQKQLEYWRRMLAQEGKTDEEVLHDAWRGPGNMWVFVRPDRFPIANTLAANPLLVISGCSGVGTMTFDALPLDILIHICRWLPIKSLHMMLCTNRRLRHEIQPHANMIAYQQIITHEPHLLPAGPFDLDGKHGREEIEWWDVEWAKGGIAKEESNIKIPWLLYRMECSKSMSMWNRRRIWGIAKQLEKLAIDECLLLEDGADLRKLRHTLPRY